MPVALNRRNGRLAPWAWQGKELFFYGVVVGTIKQYGTADRIVRVLNADYWARGCRGVAAFAGGHTQQIPHCCASPAKCLCECFGCRAPVRA